jgi:polysaccharide export outer membrane protein
MPNSKSLMVMVCLTSGLYACATTSNMPNSYVNVVSTSDLYTYTPTAEYRIGAGDLLEVKVFQAPELSGETRVDNNGNISLPLLGDIYVKGLTKSQLEQQVQSLLSRNLLQNPQVTVFIKEFTSQRVTIEGAVAKPGVYPIQGQMTLLQALALAGGPIDMANQKQILLLRHVSNNVKAYDINLSAIRRAQMPDPFLKNDDRIIVARSQARVLVRDAGTVLSPLGSLSYIINNLGN